MKPKELSGTAVKRIREKELEKLKVAKENSQKVWRDTGHDYVETSRESPTGNDEELVRLQAQLVVLQTKNEQLNCQVFCIDLIKDSNSDFQKYTNLPNYQVFQAICRYLYSISDEGNLNYWRAGRTGKYRHYTATKKNKPGMKRKLSFESEFFMVLVKLKTGNFNYELAMKFGVSETTVSKIFTTWINYLHQELTFLFEMKCNWDDIET